MLTLRRSIRKDTLLVVCPIASAITIRDISDADRYVNDDEHVWRRIEMDHPECQLIRVKWGEAIRKEDV